ncbi:hypothetical protein M885DRAFT_616361 [Pelagophyceae sp. CCMP2097]|nr:hypothetical protein M885DRAFT_616361 [Pelagophyceae sp. CCMP2097]
MFFDAMPAPTTDDERREAPRRLVNRVAISARVRGKRRQRRLEHERELETKWRALLDDGAMLDDDISKSGILFRDFIADPKRLGAYLDGARGRQPNVPLRKGSRGRPLDRAAEAAWFRVEKKLRTVLKHAVRDDVALVAVVEGQILKWLGGLDGGMSSCDENAGGAASNAEDRLSSSLVLARPKDRRLVHGLAQFHGCVSKTEENEEVGWDVVVSKLGGPRRSVPVRIFDALAGRGSSLTRAVSPSPTRALRPAAPVRFFNKPRECAERARGL